MGNWKLRSKVTPSNPAPFQTLEGIEQDYWNDEPEYGSHLVTTIYRLRKKNIDEFSVEDLRIMIGQDLSLTILMPMAINVLGKNILAEGDLYTGDLLVHVLRVPSKFWADNPYLKDKFKKVFVKNIKRIKGAGLHERNKERLFSAYDQLVNGNGEQFF